MITNYNKLLQRFLKRLLTFPFTHREKPILAVFHQDWCGACQRKNLSIFCRNLYLHSFCCSTITKNLNFNFSFPLRNSSKMFWRILKSSGMFWEPSQSSKLKFFAKIVSGCKKLHIRCLSCFWICPWNLNSNFSWGVASWCEKVTIFFFF